MTKKEIIEVFKVIIRKCDCIINNKYYTADDYVQDKVEDIAEMCHKVLDGQFGEIIENKLPSNLDDAALKAYPKMSRLSEPHGVIPADNKTYYLGDANEENRAAFKAGAEWMAEQGETQEHFVIGHTEASRGIPVIVSFPENFEIGDNVIVQIRKKEE